MLCSNDSSTCHLAAPAEREGKMIPLQQVWPAVWGVTAQDDSCGPVQGDVRGLRSVQFPYALPECSVNWVHDGYTLLF